MVCDAPDNCSNCNEERIIPWVQDYPSLFNYDDYNQSSCSDEGLEWAVGDQIFHAEMDESTCLENQYFWDESQVVSYPDLNQIQCIENNYTWFHGECVDLNGEMCIEDIYGCSQEIDIWNNWDITLRDLVIVNAQGYETARLNLTYANPDPNSTCGENYETIKDLIINAR